MKSKGEKKKEKMNLLTYKIGGDNIFNTKRINKKLNLSRKRRRTT